MSVGPVRSSAAAITAIGSLNSGGRAETPFHVEGQMSLRRALWSAFPTACLIAVTPAAAEVFEQGRHLPRMPLFVCNSLENATKQAILSSREAQLAEPARDGAYIQDGCGFVTAAARVDYEERSIAPFEAREVIYSPDSATGKSTITIDGETHVIGYRVGKQTVRYYRIEFQHATGKWYGAYAEIPADPYVLRYLQATGRSR